MENILSADQLNFDSLCENVPFDIAFNGTNFRIVRLTHVHNNCQPWMIPYHAHESYEFHYISSGEGNISIEDETFFVQKGDFYITAPYVRHKQCSSAKNIMEEYCIECKIDLDASQRLNNGRDITSDEIRNLKLFTRNSIYMHYKYTEEMINNFHKIQELNEKALSGYLLKIEILLLEILIDSLQIAVSIQQTDKNNFFTSKEHSRLIKIKNYLDSNLCSDIRIQDVSRVFCLSPKQLNRIILKGFGMSFYQYLTNLRMNMAIRLLMQTEDTISDIAEKSGFSSYQHLYRVLKRNGYNIKQLREASNQSAALNVQ